MEVLDLVLGLNPIDVKTVIMVSHDLSQADQYADYLVAKVDGRAVEAGAPRKLPSDSLVPEMLGVESAAIPNPLTQPSLMLPGRSGGTGP